MNILGKNLSSLGLVIMVGLLAFWLGTCQDDDDWRTRYTNFRDSAQTAATQYSDSVESIVDSLLNSADSLRAKIDSQSVVDDSIAAEIVLGDRSLQQAEDSIIDVDLTQLPKDCFVCGQLVRQLTQTQIALREAKLQIGRYAARIDVLEGQVSDFKSVVILRDVVISERGMLVDSLRTVIRNMPGPPPPDRLFGILPINIGPTEGFFLGSGVALIVYELFLRR